MLLNLSNHPTQRWTDTQLQAAESAYGTIKDRPFPRVPPEADEDELDKLVAELLTEIDALRPELQAVHLMGEMTLTHRLVVALKARGIEVIASTTERTVEERDGKKIVQFQFVQFRSY